MRRKWKDEKLDALIMPPYVGSAFKNSNARDLGYIIDYTVIWSGL